VIAVLLALGSAMAYGISDFIGGLLASRMSAWTVAFCSQLGGASVVVVAALLGDGTLSWAALAWGALGGLGNGLGGVFLYRGLAAGRMGVVAPISGVGAALLPAIVGLASGERPSGLVWTGLLLALPAIYLVARTPMDAGQSAVAGVRDGMLAGAGFGLTFVAVAHSPDDAGLWSLATNLLVALPVIALGATVTGERWWPHTRLAALAPTAGLLSAAAFVLFLEATRHGFLTVTAVISSLYPAATILLAALVLHERIHRAQAVGLGLCAVAVGLVAAG
jgi:drug/metabolite transporter (DMT)-like permease